MIGQGNGSLYVFVCTRVASVDKLMCGCPGSKPKIDRGVILLHSVFLIGIDTWKNNLNKFAPKERREGRREGREKGGKDGVKDRERESGEGEGERRERGRDGGTRGR